MTVKTLLLAALALASLASGKEVRNIPYITRPGTPANLTSLDLHLPDTKPAKPQPVFILIHGGGWSVGDKRNQTFVEPKTTWLKSQGFAVASINYRLSPAVSHPAHEEDVCAAIAWVQKNIAEHGGDPERIYLLGHSAGAHLAALAAIDQARLKAAGVDPKVIKGVVLLDGAGYDIPKQIPAAQRIGPLATMYRDAFTLDAKVQIDASPALKPIKNPPPFLICHVAWRTDSGEQSNLLAAALRKAGGTATVVSVPGKSHMTINADCGKPGDPVTVALASFLKSSPKTQ